MVRSLGQLGQGFGDLVLPVVKIAQFLQEKLLQVFELPRK
jgi:hypothetical protein